MSIPTNQPSALGPFVISQLLGTDGLLHTFAATHRTESFPVVVTAIAADYVEASIRTRFATEAAQLAGQAIPHVLPPLQWGMEEGWMWSASRFIPNGDHTGKLMSASGIPPVALTAELARQVVIGLGEIHKGGIVHGAISPATIFIEMATAQATILHTPWCRVIEGLAEKYQHPMLMSVLAFSAPEVAAGTPATRESDAWSLGSLLYFLLLGRPTHWADDPASLAQALRTQKVDLDSLGPVAPPPLIALIDELLSVDPEDRPRNWAAVENRLGMIRDALGGVQLPPPEPVAPPPPISDLPTRMDTGAGAAAAAGGFPPPPPPVAAPSFPPPPPPLAPPAGPAAGLPLPSSAEIPSVQPATAPPPPPPPQKKSAPAPPQPAAAQRPAAGPVQSSGASPKSALILTIVAVGVLVLVGGGAAWLLLRGKSSDGPPGPGKKSSGAVAKPGAPGKAASGNPGAPDAASDDPYTKTAQILVGVATKHRLSTKFGGGGELKTDDKDAWGTVLQVRSSTEGLIILSAGTDKQFDSDDDIWMNYSTGKFDGKIDGIDLANIGKIAAGSQGS